MQRRESGHRLGIGKAQSGGFQTNVIFGVLRLALGGCLILQHLWGI